MTYNLKQNLEREERLCGGHRMCAGCGSPIAIRTVLRQLEPGDKAVITGATSCMEVSTFMYPYTAWKDSFIHNAFENAAATCSGVETAYRVLRKRGKVDGRYKFITFGGDGGTYDIGFQSLSGAMERGHDMVYVCYEHRDPALLLNSLVCGYHHNAGGQSSPREAAKEKGPDKNYGEPQDPICGADRIHQRFSGYQRQVAQGHLYAGRGVFECFGPVSQRLAVSHGEADGSYQAGGGELCVAPV